VTEDMANAMLKYMPLRALVSFANGALTFDMLTGIVEEANRKLSGQQ
jgi:hypothetical protein